MRCWPKTYGHDCATWVPVRGKAGPYNGWIQAQAQFRMAPVFGLVVSPGVLLCWVLPFAWVLYTFCAEVGFNPIVSAKAVIARKFRSTLAPSQRSIEQRKCCCCCCCCCCRCRCRCRCRCCCCCCWWWWWVVVVVEVVVVVVLVLLVLVLLVLGPMLVLLMMIMMLLVVVAVV